MDAARSALKQLWHWQTGCGLQRLAAVWGRWDEGRPDCRCLALIGQGKTLLVDYQDDGSLTLTQRNSDGLILGDGWKDISDSPFWLGSVGQTVDWAQALIDHDGTCTGIALSFGTGLDLQVMLLA